MAKQSAQAVLLLWCCFRAVAFRRDCPLSRERYRVEYRPGSGKYFLLGDENVEDYDDNDVVGADGASGNGGRRGAMRIEGQEHRNLRADPVELMEQNGSLAVVTGPDGNPRSQEERDLSGTSAVSQSVYLTARSCDCHHAPEPHPYCIVGIDDAESAQDLEVFSVGVTDADKCGIPRDTEQVIGCYRSSRRVDFARNSWPVIVLWYVVLVVYVFSTSAGRYARDYFFSFVCSRRNDRIVEAQLRRELEIRDRVREARAIERLRIRLAAIAVGDQADEEPLVEQSLVLRTRKYKQTSAASAREEEVAPGDEFNDAGSISDDRLVCTICMVEVVENDRIGILPCSHIFHAECLKEWIKRRNVCPLCQEPGIASPHRQSSEAGDEQSRRQQRAEGVLHGGAALGTREQRVDGEAGRTSGGELS